MGTAGDHPFRYKWFSDATTQGENHNNNKKAPSYVQKRAHFPLTRATAAFTRSTICIPLSQLRAILAGPLTWQEKRFQHASPRGILNSAISRISAPARRCQTRRERLQPCRRNGGARYKEIKRDKGGWKKRRREKYVEGALEQPRLGGKYSRRKKKTRGQTRNSRRTPASTATTRR